VAMELAGLVSSCLGAVLWSAEGLEGGVVLLPLGSLEDHPRGVPAALDTVLALAASCLAARGEGWLVAPPLGYGFSPCHRRLAVGPGGPRLLEELLADIVGGLLRGGALHVAVVDGHEGHRGVAEAVAARLGASHHSVWDSLARAARVDPLDWRGLLGLEEELAGELARGRVPGALVEAARLLRGEIAGVVARKLRAMGAR